MKNTTALVTGAFGFSASHLICELLARGDRVVGTDLPQSLDNPDQQELVKSIGMDPQHPNLELIPANLLDKSSLEKVFEKAGKVNNLFHTASLYDYRASLEVLRKVNVEGTKNLLEIVAEKKVDRFIHWSTCGVFGKPYKKGKKANIPFTEDSSSPRNSDFGQKQPENTHLVNAYSVSKWEQEQMIWKTHREQNLPVTVIRPAPIYGRSSRYGHGGIIVAIAKGFVPAIPSDAKNSITTSVHAQDLARFAIHVANDPSTIGEDFNVVDNSVISYQEFLHYIALLTGRKIINIPLLPLSLVRMIAIPMASSWTWLERTFNIPRVRVLEVQSATYIGSSYWISNRKSLSTGFQYLYPDVKEGLKDTVAWFRKTGWIR